MDIKNFKGSTGNRMDGYDFDNIKNVDTYIRRSLAGIGRTTTKIIHDNLSNNFAEITYFVDGEINQKTHLNYSKVNFSSNKEISPSG